MPETITSEEKPMPLSRGTNSKPLNVCIVSPVSGQANGGTAAYIRLIGQHLARHGHSVSGIARLATDVKGNLRYEQSDADASSKEVDLGEWKTRLVGPRAVTRPILAQLGRVLPRPALQSATIKAFEAGYVSSMNAAIPQNTDIIHYVGTGWELLGFAAHAVARKRGIAFTVLPFAHPGAWGDAPLDARLYNLADAVFVCSDAERKHLQSVGVRSELFRKTGMAPASAEIGNAQAFREKHGLKNRPLVFFLARKQRYKGYHVLCQAWAKVVEAVPDACLVAAGPDSEPPYPAVPEGSLLDLGELKPNPVDAQHKADALAACDVFCMPSEAEAFGIVYVEAWANAKPVIAGTAPAVAELVNEGVNGYITAQDQNRIAELLIKLLRDPEGRQKMGQAGYHMQQEHFTWETVVRTHEKIFREAIAAQSH